MKSKDLLQISNLSLCMGVQSQRMKQQFLFMISLITWLSLAIGYNKSLGYILTLAGSLIHLVTLMLTRAFLLILESTHWSMQGCLINFLWTGLIIKRKMLFGSQLLQRLLVSPLLSSLTYFLIITQLLMVFLYSMVEIECQITKMNQRFSKWTIMLKS